MALQGPAAPPVLAARGLTLAYEDAIVATGLDLDVTEGTVTVIIGPNGSGKSTLLRALARLMAPKAGVVLLDGTDIRDQPTREVARRLGLLPQSPPLSVSITVEELVGRGRYPHRRWFEAWSKADEQAVEEALAMAHLSELRRRPVDHLSGGQRQRVWIAMALAQQAPVMLLDEPTTHLDMAHRLEVLDLLAALNRDLGRTVVMVMHELDEAARYADRLVAMRDGQVVASGPPVEVVTAEMVDAVFGVRCRIVDDPFTGRPRCVPEPRPLSPCEAAAKPTGDDYRGPDPAKCHRFDGRSAVGGRGGGSRGRAAGPGVQLRAHWGDGAGGRGGWGRPGGREPRRRARLRHGAGGRPPGRPRHGHHAGGAAAGAGRGPRHR